MEFIVYDLILLVLFFSGISFFLYKNKKNLKKEGMLILYKAGWGIKLMEKIGAKCPKLMKSLSYFVIALGYLLMGTVIYLFGKIVWIYASRADIVRAVKVPPIMPLIPYMPQMFKITWLPDFYFTYWIVILAVIAISHEFAHGVFAIYHKVKVKTTGFGFFPHFLPIFLAAFVELDEVRMSRQTKFKQMSVLAAGVFANVLTALITLALMWGLFTLAFSPSGVIFDGYATTAINFSNENLTDINGFELDSDADVTLIFDSIESNAIVNLSTTGGKYFATHEMLNSVQEINGDLFILTYYDAPAIRANLTGAIVSINDNNIKSLEDLNLELRGHSPNETILIKTTTGEYNITLESAPNNESRAWLGIGFRDKTPSGLIGALTQKLTSYKNDNVYYTSNWGNLSEFLYNLLWWTMLISISVALVNMLPVGIFDGGRFFYLTVAGITGSEKIAKKTFAITTWLFFVVIAALMAFWAISFF